MKKLALLLSVIVVGLFLSSCTPDTSVSIENTTWTGYMTFNGLTAPVDLTFKNWKFTMFVDLSETVGTLTVIGTYTYSPPTASLSFISSLDSDGKVSDMTGSTLSAVIQGRNLTLYTATSPVNFVLK